MNFTPGSQKLTQRGWSEEKRSEACRTPLLTGGVIVAPERNRKKIT